ncbi:MAG: proliferating cell nuclear antigen (pcna) [Candidatus Aenigmatarchaeota archaeon]
MFEAYMEDVSLLRDSIATISELIDETELHLGKDGIKMVASDRTVVAVVDFFLSKNSFIEYNCEKDIKIGINLLNLLQILRRAKPDDSLRIKLTDNSLNITLESNMKRDFTLPLIAISKEDVPNLEKIDEGFSAHFEMDSEALSHGFDDAELITDSVIFTLRKDQIILNSQSDSSSSQLELKPGEWFKISNINEPVRARYSLDYLKKMIKAKKLSQWAKISMATDYPIKFQFSVPNKMQMNFILAPRVEEG